MRSFETLLTITRLRRPQSTIKSQSDDMLDSTNKDLRRKGFRIGFVKHIDIHPHTFFEHGNINHCFPVQNRNIENHRS
jgi:hypothetical protein